MISDRSSSLIAATMTIMARPSAESVSTFSRKLTKAMFKTGEFIQHFEEMADRTGHPVECPDQNHIESPAPCIGHKPIKPRSFSLRSADCVGILANNLVAASSRQGAKVAELP